MLDIKYIEVFNFSKENILKRRFNALSCILAAREKEGYTDIKLRTKEANIRYEIAEIYNSDPNDKLNALDYYRESALLGNIKALRKLENIYSFIRNNEQEVLNWFKQKNSLRLYYTLGLLYKNGEGFKQNYSEALNYFKLVAEAELYASEGRNEYAMFELGELYYNGWGVPKNFEEAIKWYKLASDRWFSGGCSSEPDESNQEDCLQDVDFELPFQAGDELVPF